MNQAIDQAPSEQSTDGHRPGSSLHSASRNKERRSLLGLFLGIFRAFPTLFVLLVLVAVAVYGHTHHWKPPTFAAIMGESTPEFDDWCEEHAVPESQCVECNPVLMPKLPDYGWCVEHGVHNCTLHHPDVAQVKVTPDISSTQLEQAALGLNLRKRPQNNAACNVHLRRVQFASIDAVREAGIDVELIDVEPMTEAINVNGEIRYDATQYARLSSRVPGTTWRVFKNVGDPVREGEILALIDAMEVGRLKGELVKALVAEKLARQNLNRLADLSAGVVPGKEILEVNAASASAEAEVLSCEQALANLGLPVELNDLRQLDQSAMVERLRFLGLPSALVQSLSAATATSNLIPLRSPINGVVVEREVVVGEVVDNSQPLFDVADPQRMWMFLNVPLEEAGLLHLGQPAIFQPDGSESEVVGNLSWISTAADPQTRMVRARADLDNSTGQLRDETFGTGRIVLRSVAETVLIPKESVHWEGCCQIVFVRDKDFYTKPDSPKVFHVRNVRTGADVGDRVEILVGLLPGEVVVTKGSDVLRAQLLKNSLGEGCCAE